MRRFVGVVVLAVGVASSTLLVQACGGKSGGGGGVPAPPVSSVSVSTTSLPTAAPGQAYATTLNASGVTGTPTWSIVSGSLPAGIALGSNGSIAGTAPSATQRTRSSFKVRVTDSGSGLSADKDLNLDIIPPFTITTASPLTTATKGQSYSVTFAATGGNPPLTWTVNSGALPAGLTLSTSGTISGTPTTAGTTTFGVLVQDTTDAIGGASSSKNFSITVN